MTPEAKSWKYYEKSMELRGDKKSVVKSHSDVKGLFSIGLGAHEIPPTQSERANELLKTCSQYSPTRVSASILNFRRRGRSHILFLTFNFWPNLQDDGPRGFPPPHTAFGSRRSRRTTVHLRPHCYHTTPGALLNTRPFDASASRSTSSHRHPSWNPI